MRTWSHLQAFPLYFSFHFSPLLAVAPRAVKLALGEINSQFRGTAQQDAQEALALILDSLHEDLNRVVNKTYIKIKDSDDRPDEEVAAEAWGAYLARNRSIVVDVFQAQLRSTLTCAKCGVRV